jgi:hypothetical protein
MSARSDWSVRIADGSTGIRTWCLPNTSLGNYHCAYLRGKIKNSGLLKMLFLNSRAGTMKISGKVIIKFLEPITIAAWSKAWIIFACSNTGIVGSNPTWGMDIVCVYSVSVLSCIQWGNPSSKESYWPCKRLRNWKSRQGPTNDCRATDEWINEWQN